jgi:hypothetical protein
VSHPSLGLPPPDRPTAWSDIARQIRDNGTLLAARALAVAMERDPTLRERYDEVGLRERLHDAEVLAERIAAAVAEDDPHVAGNYADWTSPVYRRKRVPLDDLINLCEGLRAAIAGALAPPVADAADLAIDAAIAQYRWHRRIAGDARKRNRLLQLIYKGA